jgi:hypothetical protein
MMERCTNDDDLGSKWAKGQGACTNQTVQLATTLAGIWLFERKAWKFCYEFECSTGGWILNISRICMSVSKFWEWIRVFSLQLYGRYMKLVKKKKSKRVGMFSHESECSLAVTSAKTKTHFAQICLCFCLYVCEYILWSCVYRSFSGCFSRPQRTS